MRYLTSMLLFVVSSFIAVAAVPEFTPTKTPVSPTGLRSAVDLPGELHQRNTGGSDGLGLCVFSAFEDECEYMGYTQMRGFHKWMESKPGGGWPAKLDQMVAEFCREKGVEKPEYLQHTGGDEALLELAIKTRRGACTTYSGMDDFYSGDINHMVVLSEFGRSDQTSIMDNNRPGEWIWMTRKEYTFRWKLNTVGQGWAVILLGPPPPPSMDGMDPVPPKPSPKPKPPRKPFRPFRPWLKVNLSDGGILWKLFDEDGKLHGVWDERGWHKAVTPDGWTPDASGQPPIDPPDAVHFRAADVTWQTDWAKAAKESKDKNLPMLVVFSSTNCRWCKVLADGTLKDPAVTAKINALFVPVKVNDPDASWMRNFGVRAFPTSVILTPGGEKILDNVEEAVGVNEFLHFLQDNVKPINTYRKNGLTIDQDEAHKLVDDSQKWYVTAVVKTEAEKKALVDHLASNELAVPLSDVHLNVYVSDFWAAGRVKHALNVQAPYGKENPVVWFSDELKDQDFFNALVKVGLLEAPKPDPTPAPAPKPVDPVKPDETQPPVDNSIGAPITMPLWVFWSVVGGASFFFYKLRS